MLKTCQSCGMPMTSSEHYADGDENSEFCSYCMVKGEYTSTRDEVKNKLAEHLMEEGVPEEEARVRAENQMMELKRWKE